MFHEKKFSCFSRNTNNKQLLDRLKDLQTQLNSFIEKSKGKCYLQIAGKLTDIRKSSETYWSILKSFLVGKNVPFILPILESNKNIPDFKKKLELFNSFFADQCSLINNNSQLPLAFSHKINEKLSSVEISDDEILKIISKLDPIKHMNMIRSVFSE